ncbi:response regulator receiver domain-containing protein [Litoreibacter ponti]|uniref:Response regulator receiver domain-containing protein n=1 Tax=Litoreibacter ponti TaxID=1510457 RepID=A0A2T6BNI8_9RHOB|nr:response regulator [Litoreibacter ponti]PTX57612.1 response regulator receiver domain-containing protein [Litoreibacter ponti]
MNILLVEDNDIDVILFRRALKGSGHENALVRAHDGLEALDILKERHCETKIEDPFVILLDINMPRMNGHDFLEALRHEEGLRKSRVVVITTSDDPRDIDRAYERQACGYVVKPVGTSEMRETIDTLNRFWDICEAPKTSGDRSLDRI